jgi:ElaB/YqjD/DUF883 family membrane-anchored ribosome-binding protein
MNEESTSEPNLERRDERRKPDEIESDIERTRARVAQELNAIGDKFSTEHMKTEAKRAVRHAAADASERVRRVGRSFGDSVRDNPVPVAMVGIGLGWLVVSALRRPRRYEPYWDDRYGYSDELDAYGHTALEAQRMAGDNGNGARRKIAERAEHAVERISEAKRETMQHARELGQHARELGQRAGRSVSWRARRAEHGIESLYEQNPLAVGAAAVGVGVIAGLLLPSSDVEDRMMGGVRDELLEQARSKAHEVEDIARSAAREGFEQAKRTASQEAEQREFYSKQS